MKKEESKNTATGTENTNTSSQNTGSVVSQLATIENGVAQITSLVSTITATGITEVGDKVMKEYRFTSPLGKRETLKTFDGEVIASTEKIAAALAGQKILTFVVCKELANLNNKETLAKMGFKTISEYGKALFGFQKATCNLYAKVGRVFINDEYKLKSDVLPSSLTVGHLIELSSYVGEDDNIADIENAYINGDITDGLSTKKLREALNTAFNSIEGSATESTTESTTESPAETGSVKSQNTPAETETTGSQNTSTVNPLQKDVAKVFAATIFLRDFVKEHFADDQEFSEGVANILSVLDEASKALLTAKVE